MNQIETAEAERFIPARAGNTEWIHSSKAACTGSSPLARGTQDLRPVPLLHRRFIPARAGNTSWPSRPACGSSVHPRSRGEHSTGFSPIPVWSGSSPLARGTRREPPRGRPAPRFIPARAGNTSRAAPRPSRSSVHPRSRGEHATRPELTAASNGSSPLARGTRSECRELRGGHRFIPARAGNTEGCPRSRCRPSVHPRSRGEHHTFGPGDETIPGSSPLARGTRLPRLLGIEPFRFIPARAGNTPPEPPAPESPPVHPRSRGEHARRARIAWAFIGSSPLARGTPSTVSRRHPKHRFIPARAGNTSGTASSGPRTPVHPRSRGEHRAKPVERAFGDGSSPLARGTPSSCRRPSRRPSVHPRSRGEHASQKPLINHVFSDEKERTNCSTDNSEDREAVRLALHSQAPVCSE